MIRLRIGPQTAAFVAFHQTAHSGVLRQPEGALLDQYRSHIGPIDDVVVDRHCGHCGAAGHGKTQLRRHGRVVANASVSWSNYSMITALSPDRVSIGVDLEHEDSGARLDDAADIWCRPREVAAIKETGDLVALWTEKEAVAKALGLGLMLDFRQIDTSRRLVLSGLGIPTHSFTRFRLPIPGFVATLVAVYEY